MAWRGSMARQLKMAAKRSVKERRYQNERAISKIEIMWLATK